jgi:hypothetical protein
LVAAGVGDAELVWHPRFTDVSNRRLSRVAVAAPSQGMDEDTIQMSHPLGSSENVTRKTTQLQRHLSEMLAFSMIRPSR